MPCIIHYEGRRVLNAFYFKIKAFCCKRYVKKILTYLPIYSLFFGIDAAFANTCFYNSDSTFTWVAAIKNKTSQQIIVNYQYIKNDHNNGTYHTVIPPNGSNQTTILSQYCQTPGDDLLVFSITTADGKTFSSSNSLPVCWLPTPTSMSNSDTGSPGTAFFCSYPTYYGKTLHGNENQCPYHAGTTQESVFTNYYAVVEGIQAPYTKYSLIWKVPATVANGQLLANKLVSLLKSNNSFTGRYDTFIGNYNQDNKEIKLILTQTANAAYNPYSQATTSDQCSRIYASL